ncbi:hypothetical protein [Vibrio phage BUCT194]|uniref:Uncharacterized protein n=1 Tax=Vibrio phage BUCT194 TaxID=2859072 RepID=A0AAE9BPI5_9CAUD|nr:hypothetical protein PP741_gp029 [Vibrio phage BUCT194]UAW01196.1 hypothetical protein [Vibrio phage BUCT194]
MQVRKIKAKERNNGMRYCTFCKPSKVDAIWRDWRMNFACEEHKHLLDNQQDNGNYSEADYQTWMNL